MYADSVHLLPANQWLIISYSLWSFFLMAYLARQSVPRLYSVSDKWMNECEYGILLEWCQWENWILRVEEKPVPVPLYVPQTPYWLAWDQTWSFEVGSFWLSTWIVNSSLCFMVMNFVLVTEVGIWLLAVCQYLLICDNTYINLIFHPCSLCSNYHTEPFKSSTVRKV